MYLAASKTGTLFHWMQKREKKWYAFLFEKKLSVDSIRLCGYATFNRGYIQSEHNSAPLVIILLRSNSPMRIKSLSCECHCTIIQCSMILFNIFRFNANQHEKILSQGYSAIFDADYINKK